MAEYIVPYETLRDHICGTRDRDEASVEVLYLTSEQENMIAFIVNLN